MRDGPEADLDHAARRRRASPSTATSSSGRSGSSASASIRTKGSCCTRSPTTTTAGTRSILHRASISEMVVPYGDPERAARLEERVRRGGVGPRPDDAAAHARLRLPRRDPLLRRDARERAGQAVGHQRTRSACTKRTTGSSGSTSTCWGGRSRGAPEPSPRRQLHFNCRQLRVRLLLVLLPRRQHPARGEAHRHRVADGDRARHAARVRERDRAKASPRRTTSTCSTPGSTSTSTAPTNEVYEVEAERMPPGPDNPWLNAFRPEATRFETETDAQRETDAAHSRTWRIANPNVRNGLGQPTAYKLVPTMSTPTLLAHPDSPIGRRAGVRAAQPLGHAVRARRAARRGRVPESALRRRRPAALDRAGPLDRRHRCRRLVHVRRHALRAARGLAGDAGRVHGLHC